MQTGAECASLCRVCVCALRTERERGVTGCGHFGDGRPPPSGRCAGVRIFVQGFPHRECDARETTTPTWTCTPHLQLHAHAPLPPMIFAFHGSIRAHGSRVPYLREGARKLADATRDWARRQFRRSDSKINHNLCAPHAHPQPHTHVTPLSSRSRLSRYGAALSCPKRRAHIADRIAPLLVLPARSLLVTQEAPPCSRMSLCRQPPRWRVAPPAPR